MAKKKVIRDRVYRVEVSWFTRHQDHGPPLSTRQAKQQGWLCSEDFTVLATDVKDAMEQVKKIEIIEFTYKPTFPPTDVIITNRELIFDEVEHLCTLYEPKTYKYSEHHNRSRYD